ncbi:MAG TPA: hypothetical protein VIJ56_12945 [Acidimicrobiales bacterium]
MTQTEDTAKARAAENGHLPYEAVTATKAAHDFLGDLFDNDPLAQKQLEEARAARQDRRRCEREAVVASAKAAAARTRVAATARAKDSSGTHKVPRAVAFGGAGALACLDIVPADMAAQSFGLDRTVTDAVALLIVVALAGAMVLLDTKVARGNRGPLVKGAVAAGFLLLAALRTTFLVETSSASLPAALLASAALTAVSALLVVMGAALLGHRVPTELAADQAEATATAKGDALAQAALAVATAEDERTYGALWGTVSVRALVRRPTGLDPVEFAAAVRDALEGLLIPITG